MTAQDVRITPRGAAPATTGGCSCCGPSAVPAPATQRSGEGRVTSRYAVAGMTCGHCVSAVSAALGDLDGVSGVEVDLDAGGVSTVTVASAEVLDVESVANAVDEAGYRLVQRS